jgi:hypothetical protein
LMVITLSLAVAPMDAAICQESDSRIITPDPADKDLKGVGKFKGSLGGMLDAWMDSGKGWNRPPYVSEEEMDFGSDCGTGPGRAPFGPTPDGPGC